jgi:membrane protease YdiL (CAAX protease family)
VALDEPEGKEETVRWGVGDALLGLGLSLLLPAFVGLAVYAVAGWDRSDDVPLWGVALLQIPLWACLLGVPLWATHRKGRRSLARDFGFRMQWSDIPLGLGVGLVAQFVLGLAINLLYRLLGIDLDKVGETAKQLTDVAVGPVEVIVLVLVVAVAAPLLEELFYRGLWLRSVEKRFGPVAGVAVSSLIFALVHFEPYDFLALFGFAVVIAVLALRTGRLGPSIWAHVAFNLTAVISLLASR